jgi:hypothetical protein
LVNDFNPEWKDLSKEIGVDNDFVDATKEHYREDCGGLRVKPAMTAITLSEVEKSFLDTIQGIRMGLKGWDDE